MPCGTCDLLRVKIERLNELLHEAKAPLADEIRPRLIAALERAALTFAQEHPDAPRRGIFRSTPLRVSIAIPAIRQHRPAS